MRSMAVELGPTFFGFFLFWQKKETRRQAKQAPNQQR
jgi:hypothetical protein